MAVKGEIILEFIWNNNSYTVIRKTWKYVHIRFKWFIFMFFNFLQMKHEIWIWDFVLAAGYGYCLFAYFAYVCLFCQFENFGEFIIFLNNGVGDVSQFLPKKSLNESCCKWEIFLIIGLWNSIFQLELWLFGFNKEILREFVKVFVLINCHWVDYV